MRMTMNGYRTVVNFINVIRESYLYEIFGAKTSNPKHSFVIFGAKILYKKCVRKTLMKLTPELLKISRNRNLTFRGVRRPSVVSPNSSVSCKRAWRSFLWRASLDESKK